MNDLTRTEQTLNVLYKAYIVQLLALYKISEGDGDPKTQAKLALQAVCEIVDTEFGDGYRKGNLQINADIN